MYLGTILKDSRCVAIGRLTIYVTEIVSEGSFGIVSARCQIWRVIATDPIKYRTCPMACKFSESS